MIEIKNYGNSVIDAILTSYDQYLGENQMVSLTVDSLIETIECMNDEEVARFGKALSRCGVSVVITKKLVSVPPVTLKKYEGIKKGSPLDE